MPANVFAFISDGIVRHAGRCWWQLLCAHISGHIFGVLSSICVRITAHSGGCRNSAMLMGCWPAGTCWWASSQLLLSTVQGLNMQTSDGMSRQCGQCMRPGCPVSSPDSRVDDGGSTSVLLDQPFASSEMGDSMDTDLMPDLSGETWVAATLSDELTADLPLAGSDLDLIASQLVVPVRERQDMIGRFHDSLFVGHLGVSRTAYRLLDRAY